MKEITSVRLSSNDVIIKDIKATLYQLLDDSFKVVIFRNGRKNEYNFIDSLYPSIKKEMFLKGENRISGFSSLNINRFGYLLNEAIINQSRIDKATYTIIQDPYLETYKKRKLGIDPYHLNNGSFIYINWLIDDKKIDADDFYVDGVEVGISKLGRNKLNIVKEVQIIKETDIFTIDTNNKIVNDLPKNRKKYSGNITDTYIIDEVIRLWKLNVVSYNLNICKDSLSECSAIEYKRPNEISNIEPVVVDQLVKKKLNIDIITKNIKTREDFIVKIKII